MLLSLSSLVAASALREFVDDAGVTHTTSDDAPTIVTSAFDALSLINFGVDGEQIWATYGERGTSGSNVGGVYANGNAIGFGDYHANASYDPTLFPNDPTSSETALIAQALDLSPDCSAGNFWCASFEIPLLDAKGWPSFLVQGAWGGGWPITDDVRGNAAVQGTPIITISRTDPETGITRGFIEMVALHEKLAVFLGSADAAGQSAADKGLLCGAVESFKRITKAAQERGVRAGATYAPYLLTTDGVAAGWLYSPAQDMVLMMLEELGMPILHFNGKSETMTDYTVGYMNASDLHSAPGLVPQVDYPVDFWLYDVRVALDFTSPAFAAAWPHPAVVAKQYAYWPYGGHVYSYHHAQEILHLVGKHLATAARLLPSTACTAVGDIDGDTHRTDGLDPGQYACYAPKTYAWCENIPSIHSYAIEAAYDEGYAAAAVDWQAEATAAGWGPLCTGVQTPAQRRTQEGLRQRRVAKMSVGEQWW